MLIDGTVFAVYSVLCAILHELSHIIALRVTGGKVRTLSASAKGIALGTYALSYRQEAVVALCGPLTSLALCILFTVLSAIFEYNQNLVFIAVSNLALFTVNALPVYPLDMGRAVFCFLCLKTEREKAVKILKFISFIFLLPLCALSVIILLRSGFNLSLLIICIYLLIYLMGAADI